MAPEARGKHAFIKENNIHQMLFFLVDAFPDAKFIFQVRDPRDFLLSCVARRKRWLGNKFGSIRNAMNVYDYGPDLADVTAEFMAANAPYTPYLDGRITKK